MSSSTDDELRLHALALDFANDLDVRLRSILTDVPTITAFVRSGHRPRLVIAPRSAASSMEFAAIPLRIAGKHRLNLRVEMNCIWDRAQRFLTIDQSKFAVETLGAGTRAQPMLRYEYERDVAPGLPCAHLHVHAHRDETTWLMSIGERGRSRAYESQDKMPVLANLHFPLGGHRFRPCIEDVLEFLITEFCVETLDTEWRSALHAGRAAWRRKQIGAAVRDSPDDAAETLRHLGWEVSAPAGARRAEDADRLTAF